MRYKAIERNDEVFMSLIEEEVKRQKGENERKYPHASADKKKYVLDRYKNELADYVIKRLEENDDIERIPYFEYEDDSYDYDEDGKRGVDLSLAHIARVIGHYEREIWLGIEAEEFHEEREYDDAREVLFHQLKVRFLESKKKEGEKYKDLMDSETQDFYHTSFVKAFNWWKVQRKEHNIEEIKKLYVREVELQIPFQYQLAMKSVREGYKLYTIFFK